VVDSTPVVVVVGLGVVDLMVVDSVPAATVGTVVVLLDGRRLGRGRRVGRRVGRTVRRVGRPGRRVGRPGRPGRPGRRRMEAGRCGNTQNNHK